MTDENMNTRINWTNTPIQNNRSTSISDQVMIEIIHALKEIMIKYITNKYQSNAEKWFPIAIWKLYSIKYELHKKRPAW